jgi:hypothetical protein
MASSWTFRQHISVRASTLILIYIVVLFVIGFARLHAGALPEPAETFLAASGWSLPWLLLVAALLALAFFVASLVAKSPQLQFLVELLLALGAVVLMPVY